ncbi:MAG: ROK family protein [Succinivibrionaceae bacterium]|nr:ROK family protein [Succinivibrionaceae bacterium]
MYSLGIDLGGTKIEIVAIDEQGREVARKRIASPRGSYNETVATMVGLVGEVERKIGPGNPLGVAIPGSISSRGTIKNANSWWLNGRDLRGDLVRALRRDEVYLENDANCFVLSEAEDGAGHGHEVVWGLILGTGCGSGVAIGRQVLRGRNSLTGEWGHNPLPWMDPEEEQMARSAHCYCGKIGCIETFVSGTGFEREYERLTGQRLPGVELGKLVAAQDGPAMIAYVHYLDRLARAIACYANFLDPDIIVLGGGMSNVDLLYEGLPIFIRRYIFGGEFSTPITKAVHGDSSGVRGAAWLPRIKGQGERPLLLIS